MTIAITTIFIRNILLLVSINKHILIILLTLELINIIIYLSLINIIQNTNEIFILLIFLGIIAIESAMGLTLLINTVREHNKERFFLINLLES